MTPPPLTSKSGSVKLEVGPIQKHAFGMAFYRCCCLKKVWPAEIQFVSLTAVQNNPNKEDATILEFLVALCHI